MGVQDFFNFFRDAGSHGTPNAAPGDKTQQTAAQSLTKAAASTAQAASAATAAAKACQEVAAKVQGGGKGGEDKDKMAEAKEAGKHWFSNLWKGIGPHVEKAADRMGVSGPLKGLTSLLGGGGGQGHGGGTPASTLMSATLQAMHTPPAPGGAAGTFRAPWGAIPPSGAEKQAATLAGGMFNPGAAGGAGEAAAGAAAGGEAAAAGGAAGGLAGAAGAAIMSNPLIAVGLALAALPGIIKKFADALLESQDDLKKYSGQIAFASAMLQVQRTQRSIAEAQAVATSYRHLTESTNAYEEQTHPIAVGAKIVANETASVLLDIAGYAETIVEWTAYIGGPIGMMLKALRWIGENTSKEPDAPDWQTIAGDLAAVGKDIRAHHRDAGGMKIGVPVNPHGFPK